MKNSRHFLLIIAAVLFFCTNASCQYTVIDKFTLPGYNWNFETRSSFDLQTIVFSNYTKGQIATYSPGDKIKILDLSSEPQSSSLTFVGQSDTKGELLVRNYNNNQFDHLLISLGNLSYLNLSKKLNSNKLFFLNDNHLFEIGEDFELAIYNLDLKLIKKLAPAEIKELIHRTALDDLRKLKFTPEVGKLEDIKIDFLLNFNDQSSMLSVGIISNEKFINNSYFFGNFSWDAESSNLDFISGLTANKDERRYKLDKYYCYNHEKYNSFKINGITSFRALGNESIINASNKFPQIIKIEELSNATEVSILDYTSAAGKKSECDKLKFYSKSQSGAINRSVRESFPDLTINIPEASALYFKLPSMYLNHKIKVSLYTYSYSNTNLTMLSSKKFKSANDLFSMGFKLEALDKNRFYKLTIKVVGTDKQYVIDVSPYAR